LLAARAIPGAPTTAAVPAATPADFKNRRRRTGRPVTAEELAAGLDGRIPRSDLAVAYRNLETLEQLGLVRHVHLGHAPGRYAIVRREPCEYLACERCGVVTEIEPERLDDVRRLIEEEFAFHASFTHFPVGGLCSRCALLVEAFGRRT